MTDLRRDEPNNNRKVIKERRKTALIAHKKREYEESLRKEKREIAMLLFALSQS